MLGTMAKAKKNQLGSGPPHMRQERDLSKLPWLFLGDPQWKRCRVKPSRLQVQVSLSCPVSTPNPSIFSATRAAFLNCQPPPPHQNSLPSRTGGRARGRQGAGLKMCTVSDSWLGSVFDLVLFVCFHSGWYHVCIPTA